MNTVYTYRIQEQAAVQTEQCEHLWDALSRARYDLEHQAGSVVPISITVGQCIFHAGHLQVLLGYEEQTPSSSIELDQLD
jgi:hypothetical protein